MPLTRRASIILHCLIALLDTARGWFSSYSINVPRVINVNSMLPKRQFLRHRSCGSLLRYSLNSKTQIEEITNDIAASTKKLDLLKAGVELRQGEGATNRIKYRHPLFDETNAVSKSMPPPHPGLWESCLPLRHYQNSKMRGFRELWNSPNIVAKKIEERRNALKDVQVEFIDPAVGALQLLERINLLQNDQNCPEYNIYQNEGKYDLDPVVPKLTMAEQETLEHLTEVLAYFQGIASLQPLEKENPQPPNARVVRNLQPNCKLTRCKARIVSTIGHVGTKCPRWHADYVPVRLIMSLIGPGCEYIPHGNEFVYTDRTDLKGVERAVNRTALNGLDEEDTAKANDIIVPDHFFSPEEVAHDKQGRIIHAREGDAVLLMGREWEDSVVSGRSPTSTGVEKEKHILAAIHRSPKLLLNQGRVLLTVDLVDWDNK